MSSPDNVRTILDEQDATRENFRAAYSTLKNPPVALVQAHFKGKGKSSNRSKAWTVWNEEIDEWKTAPKTPEWTGAIIERPLSVGEQRNDLGFRNARLSLSQADPNLLSYSAV